MKAITISNYGDPGVLKVSETEQKPEPRGNEVLLKIHAAGVNFVDIYQRTGMYPVHLPFIPGLEAAGIVDAVGPDVRDVKPGDRAAYTGRLGSYSEYAVVDASRLIPLPQELSFEQGAAYPLQGMTAHYLIHEFRKPGKGDTVLVHAAAGGVGLLLVQWAKHLGAQVIGTVSTDQKAELARQAGADHAILYTKQDFASEVKRLTGDAGADLVLDGVGRSTFAGDLEAVAKRGHIVVFGSASGQADPVPPGSLMAKSISISGGTLANFTATRRELMRRSREVLKAVREGWVRLTINRVLPLSEAGEAQRLLESRESSGKIILQIAA